MTVLYPPLPGSVSVGPRLQRALPGMRAVRQWLPCPRCIGGQMVEQWDEAVCLQCGYRPVTLKRLPYTRAKWQ